MKFKKLIKGKPTLIRIRKEKKSVFEKAGFTKKDYETITLLLGFIVSASSDARVRIKCDHALKAMRRLNRSK